MSDFLKFYKGKRVLVTGHTGFKGTWLCKILTIAGAEVADMTGCPMDAMLYFVNQDIPVLGILANGEAVLITGFNEFNIVVFEPSTGKLYKKGMNDSAKWFSENGNRFITYFRQGE